MGEGGGRVTPRPRPRRHWAREVRTSAITARHLTTKSSSFSFSMRARTVEANPERSMVSRVNAVPPACPAPFPQDPPDRFAPLLVRERDGGARRDLLLPPGPAERGDGSEPTPCGSAPEVAPPPRRIRRVRGLGRACPPAYGVKAGTGGGGSGGRSTTGPLRGKVALSPATHSGPRWNAAPPPPPLPLLVRKV